MEIKDLVEAFQSGLVKVGIRGKVDVSDSSVAVSNVPHVVVDTAPAMTISNVIHAIIDSLPNISVGNVVHTIIDSLPTVTVNAHALTAGSATIGKVDVNQFAASAVLGDAVANPTEGRSGADNLLFNGTSWDRARGAGLASTTGDSGAKTTAGVGNTMTNVGNKGVQIVAKVGTITGTSPSITFYVQGSVDGGTTWYYIPNAITGVLTAAGNTALTIYPGAATVAGVAGSNGASGVANSVLPRTWRVTWDVAGTTPSLNVTAIQYQYIPN